MVYVGFCQVPSQKNKPSGFGCWCIRLSIFQLFIPTVSIRTHGEGTINYHSTTEVAPNVRDMLQKPRPGNSILEHRGCCRCGINYNHCRYLCQHCLNMANMRDTCSSQRRALKFFCFLWQGSVDCYLIIK